MTRQEEIAQNFTVVREKMREAAARRTIAKTSPPRLLAATKHVPPGEINDAVDRLGLELIGENRVDELLEKYPYLDPRAELHFIGTLQTNKVRYIIDKVRMVHSLDSVKLAAEIEKQAAKRGLVMDVLAEVNIGGEAAKSGVLPAETDEFLCAVSEFTHLRLRGLMTMAPKCGAAEEYRKYFRETYQIFIDILTKKTHNIVEPVLSMGMSASYETAIEEGADIVRVGQAPFSARVYP